MSVFSNGYEFFLVLRFWVVYFGLVMRKLFLLHDISKGAEQNAHSHSLGPRL